MNNEKQKTDWSNIRIRRETKDYLMQLKGKYSCLMYDEVLKILFEKEQTSSGELAKEQEKTE